MSQNRIQWIAAIVDRKKGTAAAEIFREMGAEVLTVIRGHGTASSRIMDCLGLDEPEKEIVTGIAGPGAAPDLFNALKSRLNFSRPRKGHRLRGSLIRRQRRHLRPPGPPGPGPQSRIQHQTTQRRTTPCQTQPPMN